MAKEGKSPETLFSKLLSRLPGSAPETTKPDLPKLKMIFFIVDWNRLKIISDVFEKKKVNFHFISKGRGTASSEVLDLLGIGASDKAVVICLEQPALVPILLQAVRENLNFRSPGAGITFTIPLSAINNPILRVFKQPETPAGSDHIDDTTTGNNSNRKRPERRRPKEPSHNLVLSVLNRGCSDDFMNTARKAGATGGTVINARGQAHEGAVKFFGISVQEERELVIILTSRDKRESIMRAVCEAHGLNSKAQGIVFSLPVDGVMSLSSLQ